MSHYAPDDVIHNVFYHGTTGLVDGDFTKTLYLNNATDSATVTITEESGGFYSSSFTPDASGLWSLDIIETGNTDIRHQGEWHVQPERAPLTAITSLTDVTAAQVWNYVTRVLTSSATDTDDTAANVSFIRSSMLRVEDALGEMQRKLKDSLKHVTI